MVGLSEKFQKSFSIKTPNNKLLNYFNPPPPVPPTIIYDDTIQQLKVLSGNANIVHCSLCKRFSQQSAQKSDKKRQKRRQKEQRKEHSKRREKSLENNTRNFVSLILKSTPSHSGSYHILDGGDFLKPLVIKSNLIT